MRKALSILWWATYIVVGLTIQQVMPGVDALTPGFLLALQEKKRNQIICLFLLFTLIQDGSGSLNFGMSLLWYGGQIVFFHLSARLFVADNLLFVTILSASLGGLRAILFWLMCALQNYPVNYPLLAHETLTQTLLIPIVWGLAAVLRPKRLQYGD